MSIRAVRTPTRTWARPMQKLLASAAKVAHSDTSLLISGETGVGKEWLARRVHDEGPRASGPFVAVNCGAIPEGLFESEFFGHVRGAFTGATRDRKGAFQLARDGTLLLDEVGDIPPLAQSKLLRALQDMEVQPVGGDAPVSVNPRIMAATNRNLRDAVERGEFRADLFYRLSVVELKVPPLRDRPEDVAFLVQQHMRDVSDRLRRPVRAITTQALRLLEDYPWPGNVRELLNVVERAVLFCPGTVLAVDDLPRTIRVHKANPSEADPADRRLMGLPLLVARDRLVAEFEASYLRRLLKTHNGHLGKAAQAADIHPRTLYNKMQEHGLKKEHFRSLQTENRAGQAESGEEE